MTQSDDNSARDSTCQPQCLGNKFVDDQQSVSVGADEKEVKRGKGNDRSVKNVTSGPNGSSGQKNSEEMGSTDSGGKTHSGGSSCGFVSSLFPNSCRGRAESFARRLHRRLTSLGGEVINTSEDEEDDPMSLGGGRDSSKKVNETSWLHGPTTQKPITTTANSNSGSVSTSSCSLQMEDRVLDSQPRHSSESDVYYDFDVELYDNAKQKAATEETDDYVTTSPAEIASEADVANIFVNRKIGRFNHSESRNATQPDYLQDSESGCVYASPLSGTSPETDNSEIFFDPESSETERTCENQEIETIENVQASGSETIVSVVFPNDGATTCKIRKHPLRRKSHRIVRTERDEDDNTSESSSSSTNPDVDETNTRIPETGFTPSSEESLNGNKSSLETTTSPSHESLWSTFDESTLSLQDDPSVCLIAPVSSCLQKSLSKSHSDSEITGNSSISNNVDEVDDVNLVILSTNDINLDPTNLENNQSPYRSSIEIPGALVIECPTDERIVTSEESLKKNEVNVRIEDTNGGSGTSGDMTRLLERIATSPHIHKNQTPKNPSNFQDEEEQRAIDRKVENESDDKNSDDGKENSEKEDEEEVQGDEPEEEEEEEVDRSQRIRRCSSLKTGKTPPGTPGRKKIVRFADVLGLDLADVRTFLDEIPKIPNSAYSDLIYDDKFHKDTSPVNFWGTGPATFTTPLYAATMPRSLPNGIKLDRILVPLFQQPGGSSSFLDQVRERLVCLENVVVEDPINLAIHGTVRVRNLDFHKSVHVRYTLDSWRNFSDLQAIYVPNSCDGFSDKFNFHLYCHTLKIGQRLELAVRFQCKGSQYWDNNSGINYCFQCLPSTSNNTGYIPITNSTNLTAPISQSMSHCNSHEWSPTFY